MPDDPRQSRRQRRMEQLLDAAWSIAREQGIAAVNLREVARRVELRQPSLYAYFDSKAGLYDLMFAQAARQLCEDIMTLPLPDDPVVALEVVTEKIVRWVASDPARQQLLFQRVVPGFAPSPASYAHAERFLAWNRHLLALAGLTDPDDLDLYTALVAGLALQQTANDPGGDRWTRRSGELVQMLLAHVRRPTG
jgi:AcrR family transcriptional regulator